MRKGLVIFVATLIVFSICTASYADREADLMNEFGTKRLQVQELEAQVEQAKAEEQQIVGMVLEARYVKQQAKIRKEKEDAKRKNNQDSPEESGHEETKD